MVLGGVSRFPTLARLPGVCDDWEADTEYELYFCCEGGGGSSNVGRVGAFGLRDAKPDGAPIESGPGCIWAERATAAATVTVAFNSGPNGQKECRGLE
ncbi:hypothetical protein Vi05172_g13074 [Venturia inaequalis]|nr:hypothetical protein Vi05172_g13074 [Venturia inaequalis]